MCILPLQAILAVLFLVVQQTAQSPIYKRAAENREQYVDRSCRNSDIASCRIMSSSNCTSLKEAMTKVYTADNVDVGSVIPHHIFSPLDLLYFGLLSEDALEVIPRADNLDSAAVVDAAAEKCDYFKRQISRQRNTKEGECEWSYSCKYNPNYFPSFTIHAELVNSNMENSCTPHTVTNRKFVRMQCLANPEEDHWCQCDAGHIDIDFYSDSQ